jgi:hypothetical protein
MSKFLYINSRDRDYQSDNTHDFYYTFNETVKITQGIILKNCSIGFGEYTVNSYNDKFYINEDLITLTKKMYKVDELVTEINTKIQVVYENMVVTYDSNLMKLIFTNDEDFDITFIENTECHILLGFKQIETYSSISNILISNAIINLQGSNMMSIYIDGIMATNYVRQKDSNLLVSYMIGINVNRGGIINYINVNNENMINLTSEFKSIRIRLFRDHKILDINGCDVNLLFMYI